MMTYHTITHADTAITDPARTEAPATPAGLGIARAEWLCTDDVANDGTNNEPHGTTVETTPVRQDMERSPAVKMGMEREPVASIHRRLDSRPVTVEQTRKEVAWQQRAGTTASILDRFRDEVLAGRPHLHLFAFMTDESSILQVMHSIANSLTLRQVATSTTRQLGSLGIGQATGYHIMLSSQCNMHGDGVKSRWECGEGPGFSCGGNKWENMLVSRR
eukprot:CCRYP_000140-RA/>CCRYP_000140-RA protein AED:0.39 eAED:0.39 QI:0/-1/0/1/-1/1/1/0/217